MDMKPIKAKSEKRTSGLVKALGRAHAAMLDDLTKLEKAAQNSVTSIADFQLRLEAAKKDVTAHFRYEEKDGYMDAVRKREPRLEHAINELAADHVRLAGALDAILSEANAAASVNETLRKKVLEWIDELTHHELRENHLVQEAFNSDVSAED
jgi:hypothetical protein